MSRNWNYHSDLHADPPDVSHASTAGQKVGTVRVSVVNPAFNAETTIEYAITSACLLTERRLAIIVVDDASSDQTPAMAAEAAEADARIRPLRQPANTGPAPHATGVSRRPRVTESHRSTLATATSPNALRHCSTWCTEWMLTGSPTTYCFAMPAVRRRVSQ